jgi:hypothetical protein
MSVGAGDGTFKIFMAQNRLGSEDYILGGILCNFYDPGGRNPQKMIR